LANTRDIGGNDIKSVLRVCFLFPSLLLSHMLFHDSFSRACQIECTNAIVLVFLHMCVRVCRSFLAFSFVFDFFFLHHNVCILLRFRTQTVLFSYIKSTSWSATLPSRTSWAVENNTNCLVNYHYYYFQYVCTCLQTVLLRRSRLRDERNYFCVIKIFF